MFVYQTIVSMILVEDQKVCLNLSFFHNMVLSSKTKNILDAKEEFNPFSGWTKPIYDQRCKSFDHLWFR